MRDGTDNRQRMFTKAESEFLTLERVARMATVNADKQPHIVPVCYAFDGKAVVTSLHVRTVRLRNVRHGSKASILVDKYEEQEGEWKVLRGLLLYGKISVLTFQENRDEFMHSWTLLIQKYPQYKQWANADLTPKDPDVRRIMKIKPTRIIRWGFE